MSQQEEHTPGFQAATDEARASAREGGIPIGAALVGEDGKVLGQGHNVRVQKGSATGHAEISALENAGRLPASVYATSTMYTTLTPCAMCTGAILLYKIRRVVIGENTSFANATQEEYLRSKAVEVVVLGDRGCEILMRDFKRERPEVWNEDIGER